MKTVPTGPAKGRPKENKGPKSLRRLSGLKPLPRDFSWQLVALVGDYLLDDCSVEFKTAFTSAVRNRDSEAYYRLGKQWGLQSIGSNASEYTALRAASTLQLSQMAKKSRELEVKTPVQRREEAVKGVIALDDTLESAYSWKDCEIKQMTRRVLAEVLSVVPDGEEVYRNARHGPGNSVHSGRDHQNGYFKYSDWPYSVTPAARRLFVSTIRSDARWWGALEESYRTKYRLAAWSVLDQTVFWDNVVKDIPYNRIVTVPKDGSKDRPIAIEPEGNIFLQLGVEGVMRKRLRRWGVDLNDQTRNQQLAHLGSLHSSTSAWRAYPATLDLSNASDTVLRSLCRDLLPTDWFELLDSLRCPWGLLPDGSAWRYAKMSSMGNGSTFALESVLFFSILTAISRVCGHPSDRKLISAYGDDCEYPCYLDGTVRSIFGQCGFQVNVAKSFSQGPVRESCGADFFNGVNIRPVYLPEEVDSLESLLALHNGLRRWFARSYGTEIPVRVSKFLRSYSDVCVTDGPECEDDMSSYWHLSRKRLMQTAAYSESGGLALVDVTAIARSAIELPGREFGFRKLMHNLVTCETASAGRFAVTKRGLGKLQLVHRTIPLQAGPQDYELLPFEEIRRA